MIFEQCSGRLFQVVSTVGYCIEFPKELVPRIGGHPEWTRHVMYRAVREGYLELYRKELRRKVLTSLRITDKGLAYVAEKSPEVFELIRSRMDGTPQGSHSSIEKIFRYQSFATAMIMASNAGATVLPKDKPSLLLRDRRMNRTDVESNICYFYSVSEIRRAMEEFSESMMVKGSRIVGVLVHGNDCLCLYDAGGSRIFWLRSIEENFAAAIQTLLNNRGFDIRVLKQVMIGSRMGVAQKLCHSCIYKGTRYFVLSNFFNNCYFVPNNREGDIQLRTLVDTAFALEVNRRALSGCRFPDVKTREYDAIHIAENRPVILNYAFDLLPISDVEEAPAGFRESPIILCFNFQVNTMQKLYDALIEVRGIGETDEFG